MLSLANDPKKRNRTQNIPSDGSGGPSPIGPPPPPSGPDDRPPNWDASIANRPMSPGEVNTIGYKPPEAPGLIGTDYSTVQGQLGPGATTTPAPQYGTQSAADQLRRTQAWEAIRAGSARPGLSPEEIQSMQNRVANRMSSESSAAERMATEQAARAGVAGSGSADRRIQELAAMNQARSSAAQGDIEMTAAQDAMNRRLQYAGLGAETAGAYGRDELAGRSLEEQALMDRMKLMESGRQANQGTAADMYRWQNEAQIADRYRTQERDDYMPLLDRITGTSKKKAGGLSSVYG